MADSLETVLECVDLDGMVEFFITELGGRLEIITPADDPREYVVAIHGSRIRLVRSSRDVPGRLRIARAGSRASSDDRVSAVAPNGTIVEFVSVTSAAVVPANRPSLSVVRATSGDAFGAGRAGMGYRDLLPDRWGGRFIASHIRIAAGGDVADYVHFHRIRFQMIFVAAGWVEVVYEDQGEPFRMVTGDCVLQPPEIRHRVLRSSPGLEVIEIGCPAEHDTLVEDEITLPTSTTDCDRVFGGQRFVRHVAASTASTPSVTPGFIERNTGIGGATDGLADARVLTRNLDVAAKSSVMTHDGEFVMYVLVAGTATLGIECDGERRCEVLGARDAVAVPPGSTWAWNNVTDDLELLQVVLPTGCIRPVDEPLKGTIDAA